MSSAKKTMAYAMSEGAMGAVCCVSVCPADTYCVPYTQHLDDGYIRDLCLQCGRIGDWQRVIFCNVIDNSREA